MNIKSLSVILFSLFTLISCKNLLNTPVNYNDTIINEQSKVVALIDSMYMSPETSISKIKDFREQLITTAENAYNISNDLEDYKGNTSFRNAAKNYFGYLVEFYTENPKIDTLIYMTNSEERLDMMNQVDFEYFEKEYVKYLELEDKVIQEQLKFAQEFNIRLDY